MSKLVFVIVVIAAVLSVVNPAIAQEAPNANIPITGYGKMSVVVGTPVFEAKIGVFVTIHAVSNHMIDIQFKGHMYMAFPGHDLTVFMGVGDTVALTAQSGPAHVDVITAKTGNAINLDKHLFLPSVVR